ncbi:lysozyme inhibitor LprI family protein [Lederbergia citrisecunda]|uniref:lysozyme inhibitor LprI family protein n=1 Tax=Lederbergia citrisecunda TaxID=2833583 RepID=UPI003D2D7244
MKNHWKLIIGMVLIVVVLAACGNSSDESQNGDSYSTEDTSNTDNYIDRTSNDENETMKEEYLQKLADINEEVEEIRRTYSNDSSTYAMKKVEGDRYDLWDGLLNEVYGVLQEQLSSDEMKQLRDEQRNWVTYRDDTAKDASLQYQGGTQERLEYVVVLADLTEERCYELVEDYMK